MNLIKYLATTAFLITLNSANALESLTCREGNCRDKSAKDDVMKTCLTKDGKFTNARRLDHKNCFKAFYEAHCKSQSPDTKLCTKMEDDLNPKPKVAPAQKSSDSQQKASNTNSQPYVHEKTLVEQCFESAIENGTDPLLCY